MQSTPQAGYGAFNGDSDGSVPAPPPTRPPPPASVASSTRPVAESLPPTTHGTVLLASFRDQGWAIISSQRSWWQLLDTSALSRPSAGETYGRLCRNVGYFHSNYVVALLCVLALGLTWHPVALLTALILAVAWFHLYLARDGPLVLGDRRFDERTVLGGLCLATLSALFTTNLMSDVLTLLAVGLLLVVLHATYRTTDDLYLDESEALSDGLMAGRAAAGRPDDVAQQV